MPIEDSSYAHLIDFSVISREVLRSGNKGISEAFRRFAKDFEESASARRGLKDAHKELAHEAQVAVVKAYSKGRKSKPYRQNDPVWPRFANGRMLRGLNNPRFIQSDYQGIYFANVTYMDKQAAQWYRLSFGTDGKVGVARSTGYGSMKFFGRSVSNRLTLEGFRPSPGFFLTSSAFFSKEFVGGRGAFVEMVPRGSGRGQAMYLAGPERKFKRSQRRASRGIRGTRFLDAGVRVINEGYGKKIEAVATEWFAKARSKM